ncbi:MAG: dicarboxylate/amino acid:cation symporter [Marinicaulis sp.]|nr:dicarboxylate/amino acid:cation symporter [Marinicaulis sp.]NNL88193.1 dicarboxylate/amino acid:cation symporter [Marinicaulis sp.]
MAWWFEIKLWKRVMLGLVLGVVFGLAVTQSMGMERGEALLSDIKVIGDLFIGLIRLVIIPLIFMTLVAGVLALGDPAKLGTIGIKTILLYLVTTFFANIIGLTMGTLFRPGAGVDLGTAEPREITAEAAGFWDRIIGMISKNPFEKFLSGDPMTLGLTAVLIGIAVIVAIRSLNKGEKLPRAAWGFVGLFTVGVMAASGDILVVIFASIILGIIFLFIGQEDGPVDRFFNYASDKVLGVTQWIMELAPFGVFALIAYVAGTKGIETFTAIFWLVMAVYLGCFLHMAVIYGGIIKFGLRLPLINFFRGILDAQMVAYSTSSSSATLPVTISNVRENLGVHKSVAGSVLPLGATINMDGTALYLGIVALFTAQAFGYTLEPHHYGLIAVTAALVSIGAAGIPSASLFLLATVLQVFDVSPEHTALVVGFIFPFDRLLDMMRTVVNVTGDATVATTVAKWEGELDEDIFRTTATQ